MERNRSESRGQLREVHGDDGGVGSVKVGSQTGGKEKASGTKRPSQDGMTE